MTLAIECADKIGGEDFEGAAREVLERCEAVAWHTEVAGVTERPFLCESMRGVHGLVRQWMRDAGMTVRRDAVGNILGHRAGKSFSSKTLVIGSHLDAVANEGKYAGVLGVMVGIAAVSLLGRGALEVGIDVVGFAGDGGGLGGGRFGTPHLGSLGMTGQLGREAWGLRDKEGITLEEAIRRFGLHPEELEFAARKKGELAGFVEVHVEQGPMLEEAGAAVGVVKSIMGQTGMQLRLVGGGGHGGTLPMKGRRDALAGAADAILVVETCAQEMEGVVATVGRMECVPNAANCVPSEVRLTVDVRHEDDTVRENSVECMLTTIQQVARDRGLGMELLSRTDTGAVAMEMEMTARLIDAMRGETVDSGGRSVQKLVNGAIQDAAVMASNAPTAMLLVRSAEDAERGVRVNCEDVAEAIRVMHALLRSYSTA